jgi:hypothetical protein
MGVSGSLRRSVADLLLALALQSSDANVLRLAA